MDPTGLAREIPVLHSNEKSLLLDAGNGDQRWRQSDLLQDQKEAMISRGWCLHHVNYLAMMYPHSAFFSLANLTPLGQIRDHAACKESLQCTAFNVDMMNYRTKHVKSDCACPMVEVPYGKIISIIKQGGVPLVAIDQSANSVATDTTSLRLTVQKRRSNTEYIAISHVWADGLGNPAQNALPACQILRLKLQLEKLPPISDSTGPIAFWMDTLCIPVDPSDERLKVQTIHNMASIYAMASHVLILDSGLMTLHSTKLSSGLIAHIICSVWMQRSWTLQEGVLAERCVFQFANKAMILSRRIARRGREYSLTWTNELEKGPGDWNSATRVKVPRLNACSTQGTATTDTGQVFLDSLIQKIICFHPKTEPGMHKEITLDAARFASVWNALAGRSTTMIEDLYLIVANVLNIQTEPLGKLSTAEEKLQHIIFSFPTLPVSLLFNSGKKRVDGGNRLNGWLPAELSRDILNLQPTMSFHKNHNVLELGPLGSGFHTYIASSATLFHESLLLEVAVRRPYLDIQVMPGGPSYRQMPYGLACFIIEHTTIGSETLIQGACFLISKISYGKHTYRPRIQLVYHAPVRAWEVSDRSQARHRPSQPLFRATHVNNSGCKLWLAYEPIPSFEPLKLHAPDNPGKRYKMFLAVAYALLSLGFYVVLLFIFFVTVPIYPLNFIIGAVFPIVLYYTSFVLAENMAYGRVRRYAQRFEATPQQTARRRTFFF